MNKATRSVIGSGVFFLVVALALVLPGCKSEPSKAVTLTASNFEQIVLKSKQPVLVDFWADWCGPCKNIAPNLEALAQKYAGRLTVAKIDLDSNPKLVEQFGVKSIPALLYFHGGKLIKSFVGYQSYGQLKLAAD